MRRILPLVIALVLTITPLLHGQAVSTAQLTGVVKDGTGAVIAGATVTATQTDTGISRTVNSGPNGVYSLNPLSPGAYRVEVTSQGFQTIVQQGIILDVGSTATADFVLKVGVATERVVIEATGSAVETQQIGIGSVISQQSIEELPLNGRQATQLITLAGATTPAPGGDMNSSKNYPTVTIAVAGGQAEGITFLLDGAVHNDPFNNLNLPLPMPDALGEFKAETSALSAQYGYHAVGAVNATTRSGTNQFHGVIFEFLRNGDLDARDTFSAIRDNLIRNQFGGAIGGPVLKNKLFFFGGYQGYVQHTSTTSTVTLPNDQMLSGDFTTFAGPSCNNGSTLTLKSPFVGNKISPSAFNQQSLNVLKFFPSISAATNSAYACGVYTYIAPNNSGENQYTGRVDFTVNAKHTIFTREFITRYNNPPYFNGVNAQTTTRAGSLDLVYSTTVGDTYLFTKDLINQARATLNRSNVQRTVASYFSPADIGVQVATLVPKYTNLGTSGSLSVGGGATNPGHFNTTTPSFSDDVLWTKGKHQFGFGALYIHAITNTQNSQYPNGSFTFGTSFTGNGVSDFLLGDLSSFSQGNFQDVRGRLNYAGLYANDTYRVTPRITVSIGLRWDPLFPTYTPDAHDMHFSQADFNNNVISTVYPNAPAGMSFPGDKNFTAGRLSNGPTDKNNFAPRIGVAWDPKGNGRTSLRASYGIFYDLPTMFNESHFASAPPWGSTISVTPPAGSFTNPYNGYPGGSPFPALFNNSGSGAIFPIGGQMLTFPSTTQTTYINQYNLSFQQQVLGGWLFKAEYIGNTTVHQDAYKELDPALYIPGTSTGVNGSCGSLTTVQGLPAAGQPCSSSTNTNNRRLLNLQNHAQGQYISTLALQDEGGTANYNGLLVSASHRMAHNISLTGNYTYSKCISDPVTHELAGDGGAFTNPANIHFDRGRCPSDFRHIVNMFGIFRSPKLGSNEALKYLTGGWELSPIVTMRSQGFITVTAAAANLQYNGIEGTRAIKTGNPYLAASTTTTTTVVPGSGVSHLQRLFILNAASFTDPAVGTYGTVPIDGIGAGVGYLDVDTALSRIFPLWSDKRQLEFRAEAFNIMNRVNYSAPSGSRTTAATFGAITADVAPRIMEIALKMRF